MGNILSPMIPTIIGFAMQALSVAFRPPGRQSPTITDIQALHRAEQAQRRAEQSAREARALAQEIRQQAEQEREQARIRQDEADQAAAQNSREVERLRTQLEEAVSAARRAQELSEAAAHIAREEATRRTWEIEDEREHSQRVHEDAQREMEAMKEDADRAQQEVDEHRRQAEEAEDVARTAAEELKRAKEAKEDAERRLKQGIQPVVTPTPAELAAAKRRVQYQDNRFHFAIAGVSGSGKSSLVNAFRGLRSADAGAAAVGVTETTLEMARYPDPNPDRPFVWYDIPGAGTLKCRDWQYFNDQGLYVFDCIVVLLDNRFTMTDVAILANARRFNIPTYVVRSKADQHVRNVIREMGYDSEAEDGENVERRLYKAAQKQFVDNTRKSVQTNLEEANLPNQRVYIVSSSMMLSIVQNKTPKKTIDEVDLINDLLKQAYSRRGARSDKSKAGKGGNGV